MPKSSLRATPNTLKVGYTPALASGYYLFAVKTDNNTSEAPGFLKPNFSKAPTEDIPLLVFLQKTIVGVTGIEGSRVRPAYQEIPPNIIEKGETWISFHIRSRKADVFSSQWESDDARTFIDHRTEECDVAISVYGSQAEQYASAFRAGIEVPQNLDKIESVKISSIECTDIYFVPEYINNRWFRKVDFVWRIRRVVDYEYDIYNIVSANGTINRDYDYSAVWFYVGETNRKSIVYSVQQLNSYNVEPSILESGYRFSIEYEEDASISGYSLPELFDVEYTNSSSINGSNLLAFVENRNQIGYSRLALTGYNAYITNVNFRVNYLPSAINGYRLGLSISSNLTE